ncbi:related to mitochondrial inheritance component mdm12 [Serendipita indica DSM 11827]|uniref:Mitochondrial distribution and morphology protein 12 n=1 Tax=Serendipita indica (strain DSM 11827) TaxID=1109443 RepID=G4TRB0_SERID|nr:related to mitochondrial inheritance component mdm12 [Serendipita indica DSM 11827]
MSIELDWSRLSTLSNRILALLNQHLETADRPSFLGPVTIDSFEFGEVAPDVTLVDIRDIYRDFLEEDEGSNSEDGSSSSEGEREGMRWDQRGEEGSYWKSGRQAQKPGHPTREETRDEDDFEWVSRRGAGQGVAETGPGYHPFPPHFRYGGTGSSGSLLDPSLPLEFGRSWSGPGIPGGTRVDHGTTSGHRSLFEPSNSSQPEDINIKDEKSSGRPKPTSITTNTIPQTIPVPTAAPPSDADTENDLQFHLRVIYNADMRISISTSLLLNYPTPLFMALPIQLTIVGFEFEAEVVVAYQNSRKRVHVCVLDDLNPYRPASASNPGDLADEHRSRFEDGSTPGMRILPHIFIESEIGQADKQVLRNVSRVERFIQDMIRSTLEDELVFPNFQTIVYDVPK